MRFHVTVDGRGGVLELARQGDACRFRFDCDGAPAVEQAADVVEVEPLVYSVLIGGRSYEAVVEQTGGSVLVSLLGHRYTVDLEDPRHRLRRGGGLSWEGRFDVAAPMPGKIVRVLVAPEQNVEEGQGLVVVEAMKMQNEMRAPKKGRVVALLVRQGDTVGAGDVLATIE